MMKIFTALPTMPEAIRGLVRTQELRGRPLFGYMLDAPNFVKREPVTMKKAIELAQRFREQHPDLLVGLQGGGQVYG